MSEFLDNLLKKAKGSDLWDETPGATPVPVKPTETNAVRRDSFDRLGWDMLCDQVPVLRDHMVELSVDYDTSPVAYEDLFNMLHQGDPRFADMARMLDTHKPQRHMLEQMFAGDEFSMLRKDTRYDEYNTAFAMTCMKDSMRQAFDEMSDALDAAAAAEQALQDAIENAEQAQDSGQGQDEASAALQAALDGQQDAQQSGQDAANGVVEQMRQSVRQARDEVKAEQSSMAGWGVEDGQLQQMSFEERRALAERLNGDKLKQLADLVGSFRAFADAERRRKVKHAPEEVVSITMGNDLTKLAPSELNNLAIPELEDQFWIRWAQHGLLQKEVRGVDKEGQGPVIVLCDESISMGAVVDNEGHTREMWSKAVSLALCDQAKRGNRDFIYIGFANARQQWRIDFPAGHTPIDKVIEFAEHFFAGGTSYEEPLTMAMDAVRTYGDAGKAKPDIVFITDDECKVSGEFIEEWRGVRDDYDVRCYGVQIGGNPYANNLKDLADNCVGLSKLNSGPEGVQHIFRTI